MWKKVITAISLMLISTLYLMACGAEGIETGEEVSEELTGELTILSWVPFNNWQYVIEDFTKEHPGGDSNGGYAKEGRTDDRGIYGKVYHQNNDRRGIRYCGG